MKNLTRRSFLNSAVLGSMVIPLNSYGVLIFDPISEPSGSRESDEGLSERMSLLFLGTGAADWSPDDYPDDKDVLLAGKHRGYSSMLINNSVLIDCGPTVPKALDMFRVDINGITDILITHSHRDHFNVNSLSSIQSRRSVKNKINLWVHEAVATHTTWADDTGCEVRSVKEFVSFDLNGFEVLPVEANHYCADTGEVCLHYILKAKDKTLFYALDGGWLTTMTWNTLKTMKLDAIVWDATWGGDDYFCLFSHNSLPMIRLMKRQLIKDNVLGIGDKIILSHLGRNYHPQHKILERNVAGDNMLAAYDGLELVI